MTKFFDPKQDVIDIQLTQYGKYLLSKGQMRPEYYAFFDNDIIYDSQYMNVSESQNEAQDRIKNKTPRTKSQYLFHGVETEVKRANIQVLDAKLDITDPSIQPTPEKAYALADPIGSCDPNSENIPTWDIKFFKAPLSSSATFMTGNHPNLNIPQLETVYELSITTVSGTATAEDEVENNEVRPGSQVVSDLFLDNSYYMADHQYLFLDLKELNTIMGTQNFDIEVFAIETVADTKTGANKEILKQLMFLPNNEDSIGVSNEALLKTQFPMLNPNYVEYYFNVEVDDEISDQVFCEAKTKFKKQDLFTDSERNPVCVDTITGPPSRYGENVEEDEVCN